MEFYNASGFYFGSIGKTQNDSSPKIFLLSYDEKLSIYNAEGKRVTQIPFSSDVSAVFIRDLFNDGNPVFISVTYSGEVRISSEQGEEIWKKRMESGILGGAIGKLDYDDQLEIVVLLENSKILVLNNQGKTMAKYQHPIDVNFVAIGKVHSSDNKIVLFSDAENCLFVLDVSDTVSKLDIPIKSITGLCSITIFDKVLLVVVDENNNVHLINKKGQIYLTIPIKKPIMSIFSGLLFSKFEEALVIITEDSHVMIFEMKATKPQEFQAQLNISDDEKLDHNLLSDEERDPLELESKKIERKPALEVNSELFQSSPKSDSSKSFSSKVEKSVLSSAASSQKSYKCPECGDFLATSLVDRIMRNKPTFCEACGAELTRRTMEEI
ncbi:MAG: zinc ribbon domain-containing protein [Promethearchaeota archaeon]